MPMGADYSFELISIGVLNHILLISKEKKNMIFGQNLEIPAIVQKSTKSIYIQDNLYLWLKSSH